MAAIIFGKPVVVRESNATCVISSGVAPSAKAFLALDTTILKKM